MNLIAKLTLAISTLLILAMIPFAHLNINAIKRLLYEEAVTSADNVSETIIKTTHYQMLENNRERVYQMIQEAGRQEGIEYIRMITKDGRIIFSTNSKEMGGNLDKTAAPCDICHAATNPLEHASPMNRSRTFKSAQAVELLGITKAIYNQESCYTAPCHFHPPDQNILGVLDTVVSLESMRIKTAQYANQLVLLTLAMLFAIGASITLMIQRQVSRPIKNILEHTRRVGALEFETRLTAKSNDEIGALAVAFNKMTDNLNVSKSELETWAHTLESKVEKRTRELAHMQAQVIQAEKLASLGEIIAGIAHELNNPLTGILVLSSLIEKEARLDPHHREDMEAIVHESQRCARIVKGLLDFSRVSVPEMVCYDINRVMESTLALIGTQSIFHDITIHTHYDKTLPKVMVDTNQLEQVFINILLNAGQAITEKGEISITTQADTSHICIQIRDNGKGIPPEHMGKIFDPFFTTKENKGTGLGLSVSYGILENHGGTIEAESQLGDGTLFTVRLPLLTGMQK